MDPRIKMALDLIEGDGGMVEERDVARSVGLGASRFRHLFDREVGTSFRQYLRGVRLKHAARALADVKARVKEVALGSGYRNPANFTRAFRRWYGVPPREFRLRELTRKPSRFG